MTRNSFFLIILNLIREDWTWLNNVLLSHLKVVQIIMTVSIHNLITCVGYTLKTLKKQKSWQNAK